MDCVNHSGVSAAAYCQHCGKALCAGCVRNAPGGQIFCEPCWTAWQSVQTPFVTPPAGAPHPALAAILGLIPGVGAMYNGQFIKGLIHVVIFAVLVSAAHVYDVFGIFIAGWIFYQAFEAYHTAKARRDGEPLPDPLGLNEVSNLFSPGGRAQQGTQPGTQSGAGTGAADAGRRVSSENQTPYQAAYQAPYQAPYAPPGYTGPGIPPIPLSTRATAALAAPGADRSRNSDCPGLLFLLGQLDWFSGRLFQLGWPILLIGLGVWLIVRRLGANSQGG